MGQTVSEKEVWEQLVPVRKKKIGSAEWANYSTLETFSDKLLCAGPR